MNESFFGKAFPTMSDNDSYNAYDADITRRLEHSEIRIKNWVIGGILANLMVLIGIGAPLVYYLGGINNQTAGMIVSMNVTNERMVKFEQFMTDQKIRQAQVDAFMATQGIKPMPSVDERH